MTVRIIAVLAAMAIAPLAPSVAAAKVQETPSTPMPQGPTRLTNPSAFEQQTRIEGDIWRNSMSEQATVITSPARMSRAERLAAMINEGKCEEAHAAAVEEGDRRLARRISQLCSLDN